MASTAIDLNRSDEQKTRVEMVLQRVFRQWGPAGKEFADAILDFFSVHAASRNTERYYSYTIVEFFSWLGWVENRDGQVPLPNRLTPGVAARYVRYLSTRGVGLTREWLSLDQFRPIMLAIYSAVERNPGATILDIQQHVATSYPLEVQTVYRRNPDGSPGDVVRMLKIDYEAEQGRGASLEDRLNQMVLARMLRREPSLDELRRGAVVGFAALPVMERPPPDVFRYYPVERTTSDVDRSSSIATRLHGLQSLWTSFIKGGVSEVGGTGVRLNIWDGAVKPIQRTAGSRAPARRAKKTPNLEILLRLLATTFSRQFQDPVAAARAFFVQRDVASRWAADTLRGATFTDARDRFVILLLSQMGLRRSEVGALTLASVSGTTLTVMGKGMKERAVSLSFAVDRAAAELHEVLKRTTWSATSALTRPLAPVVKLWGRNGANQELRRAAVGRRGMSGPAIAMMLRRRAMQAGIMPGDVVFPKVHAHGFRHLFAQMAVETGTKINVVQQILGHSNLATTSLYVEVHDPGLLISRQFQPEAPAPAAEVVAPAAPAGVVRQADAEQLAGGRVPRRRRRALPSETGEVLEPELEAAPAAAPAEPQVSPAGRRRRVVQEAVPAAAAGAAVAVAAGAAAAAEKKPKEPKERKRRAPELPTDDTTVITTTIPVPVNAEIGDVYSPKAWGERGARRQLETRRVNRAVADAMQHVYVGNASNLVWWDGSAGTLDPSMPVLSHRQVEASSDVWRLLADMWDQWGSESSRGESAQGAMLQWVLLASSMASSADLYSSAYDTKWVPFEAPIEGVAGNKKRWRQHAAAAVTRWFDTVGWQWNIGVDEVRATRQAMPRPPNKLPLWARDPEIDPLSYLPLDERHRALDWIVALTGGTPPFLDYSTDVAQAITVLSYLSKIELSLASLADAESALRDARATKSAKREKLSQAAAQYVAKAEVGVQEVVDEVKRETGRDIRAVIMSRQADRRAKLTGVRIASQYLKTVEEMFGAEIARDPVVVAYANGAAVKTGVSFDVPIAVDRAAVTIAHDRKTIAEWAKRYRMHSECVARRLVYLLWNAVSKRKKLTEGEIIGMVEDAQQFRAPCSRAQERELWSIVGARTLQEATNADIVRELDDELQQQRVALEFGTEEEQQEAAERIEQIERRADLVDITAGPEKGFAVTTPEQQRAALAAVAGGPVGGVSSIHQVVRGVRSRQEEVPAPAPAPSPVRRLSPEEIREAVARSAADSARKYATERAMGLEEKLRASRKKFSRNGRPRYAVNPMRLLYVVALMRGDQ